MSNDSDSISTVSEYDAQTFGSLEDQPLVLPDESVSVVSASSASTRGVPINQKQQYVVDIQAGGGIDNPNFSLPQLAATKQSLYGKPGSKERRKFENLLRRWKTVQRQEYNTLATSGTASAAVNSPSFQSPGRRSPGRRSPGRRSPGRRSPAVPSVVHSLTPQSPNVLPRVPSLPCSPALPRSPPLLPRSPIPRPFAPHPSTMSGTISEQLRGYLGKADAITVNTKLVEKNKPFRIVKRGEYKNAEGLVVSVYIITLADLDPRWMKRSPPPFELFHLIGSNEVLAKTPAFDYPFLFDQDAEEKGKKAAKMTDQGDLDAINIARNQVLASPDRQSAFFRLIFPEILNNDIFSPNAIDGKIKPKVHVVNGTWNSTMADGSTKTFVSTRVQLEWKIAVHEDQQRHTAVKPVANELLSEAESLLGKITINASSASTRRLNERSVEEQRALQREQQCQRAWEEQQRQDAETAAQQQALEEQQRLQEEQQRLQEELQRQDAEQQAEQQRRQAAEQQRQAVEQQAEQQRRQAAEQQAEQQGQAAEQQAEQQRQAAEQQQLQGNDGVASSAYTMKLRKEKAEREQGKQNRLSRSEARRQNKKDKKIQDHRNNNTAFQPSSLQVAAAAAADGGGDAAFTANFSSFLNDPSQAWQQPEQEVNYMEGWGWEEEEKDAEDDAEDDDEDDDEELDMLASDED